MQGTRALTSLLEYQVIIRSCSVVALLEGCTTEETRFPSGAGKDAVSMFTLLLLDVHPYVIFSE